MLEYIFLFSDDWMMCIFCKDSQLFSAFQQNRTLPSSPSSVITVSWIQADKRKVCKEIWVFSSTHIFTSSSLSLTSALFSSALLQRRLIERVIFSSDISRPDGGCGWTFTPTILQRLEKLHLHVYICLSQFFTIQQNFECVCIVWTIILTSIAFDF